jgi:hypothetical protein
MTELAADPLPVGPAPPPPLPGAVAAVEPLGHPRSTARWLAAIGDAHGRDAAVGAERLLDAIHRPRFEFTVTPSESSVAVAFRRSGRRIVPAYLRRANGRVELSLQNLAAIAPFERSGPRRILAARLEALDPAAFRWSGFPGGMPGLDLAACAAEGTARGLAALLDDILARAIGELAVPPKAPVPV